MNRNRKNPMYDNHVNLFRETMDTNDILVGALLSLTLYSYSRHVVNVELSDEPHKIQNVLDSLNIVYEEINTKGVKNILNSKKFSDIIEQLSNGKNNNDDNSEDILTGAFLSINLYFKYHSNNQRINASKLEIRRIGYVLDCLSLLYGNKVKTFKCIDSIMNSEKYKNIIEKLYKCKNQ